jgi:hypothetical protein
MAEENVTEQPQVEAPAQAEVTQDVPVKEQPAPTEVEQQAPPKSEDILRELGKWQGGFADQFGRKTKELEAKVLQAVDSRLSQYEANILKDEEARVANLEPEEQANYWRQRATSQQETAAQQGTQVTAEQQVLRQEAESMLVRYGLTGVNVNDPRLWQGYQEGMNVKESLDVLEKNLNVATTPTPAAQPAPAATPQQTAPAPQTTQGAPQKTARTVNTLSDAATLFADGNINSAQYRDIKNQIKQGGSATL